MKVIELENPVLFQLQMEHLIHDIRESWFTPEMNAKRLERLLNELN